MTPVMLRKAHALFLQNSPREGKIIPFKEVWSLLSRLRPAKDEMFELLEEMQDEGQITIISYHGIKINNKRHD